MALVTYAKTLTN